MRSVWVSFVPEVLNSFPVKNWESGNKTGFSRVSTSESGVNLVIPVGARYTAT